MTTRTDLAMENLNSDAESMPGVDVRRWEESDISLTEIRVRTDEAAPGSHGQNHTRFPPHSAFHKS